MTDPFAATAARLLSAAQALAAARLDTARIARRDPAVVWRRARLLWPTFGKG